MPGKTIGTSLNYGFAGTYAHQPDMIIDTLPNDDTTNIVFGSPVMYSGLDGFGGVKNIDATFTDGTQLVGVASRETKSNFMYPDQNQGGAYLPKEATSVFQRGSISVLCPNGTPARGGAVYVRTVVDGAMQIGDFETTAVAGENVLIPHAQWGGTKDARGVAELVLLRRANS